MEVREEAVDSWAYQDLYPYGMMKSLSKALDMVLMGYGTGGRLRPSWTNIGRELKVFFLRIFGSCHRSGDQTWTR